MNDRLIDFEAAQKPKITCIGLVFRCRHSTFMTKAGYSEQLRMNILKRQSCPGCAVCGGILEMLEEYVADGLINTGAVNRDGGLYRIQISGGGQNQSGDWDDPDMTFVPYTLPTINKSQVTKGRRVKYVPDHAHGDPTDKRCETGCIKRMADKITADDLPAAFVLYDNLETKMITGDEDYTAKRTRLENLILI